MKSTFKFLLAAVLLAGTGYAFAKPHATVKVSTSEIQDRHLSGFNAVSVGGSFDVYITQGSTESVKVEAPGEVIDRIITEVDGGVLRIYNKNNSWHWGDMWGNHKKIVVHVTAKDLNAVSLSGSGDVFFKEGITANSLKLRISGSGDMTGKVDTKTLESSISGSGDMKLSGRADNSTVSVVGSGDYTARYLVTINSAVRVIGSGDAEINASEKVDASVRGSGDIRYTGAAKNVNSNKTGSGDISRF
jgi:Putative auto-transporter adhesin, head GIN domain